MKRTSCPTRKRKALRAWGLLLAVMVLLGCTGLYHFLPVQGILEEADYLEIEDPKVLDYFYDGTLPTSRNGVYALVDGHKSMLLCNTTFYLGSGWGGGVWCKAETWEHPELSGSIYEHRQGGRHIGYVFGKTGDPSLHSVSVEVTEWGPKDRTESVRVLPLEEITWYDRPDGRCFLAPVPEDWAPNDGTIFREYALLGLDAGGETIARTKIQMRSWSTME